jgi:ribosomal protein S18 acetylase RimI-like enzyme
VREQESASSRGRQDQPESTFTIRPLRVDDVDRYWPLRLRALREEPEAFGSSYEEQCDRDIADVARRLAEMTSGDGFALGAFVGETLAGIVSLGRETYRKGRHKAGIYQVYVAPEVRGRGYGRRLMEELLARARQIDGLGQLLLAVNAANVPARSLYAALGFEPYGMERRALKLADGTMLDEELMVYWLGDHL